MNKEKHFITMVITLFALISAFCLITKEAQAVTVEETFEYTGIRELQVDGMFFEVQVSGYAGNAVEGKIIIPQRLVKGNYVEVVHSKKGSVLDVQVKKNKVVIPPVSEKAIIEIRIPRDIRVNLKTSSGGIGIEKIETDEIRLKCSSGKIRAKDLIAASISTKTSSGAIDINNCKGRLNIRSSSGRISVRNVTGDISADSSSGRQLYEGIVGNIIAESSSGSITINDQTGTLDLKATSGRLEGSNVLLEGDSSFSTSSGRISFDFKNDPDDFSFDLNSSSGILNVGQSRAKGKLMIGNGKIKITGKSSSGAQSYK